MVDDFNSKKATSWLTRAEQAYPNHSTVLELKEKLLNLNTADDKHEFKELESFLIKSLEENLLNQELHLKLIKLYLKSSHVSKAVRHLVKLLYVAHFSSPVWYKSVLEALNGCLTSSSLGESDLSLVVVMITILMCHELKSSLQSSGGSELFEIFMRFDRQLSTLQTLKPTKRAIELIKAELASQFYFLTGLMVNQGDHHQSDESQPLSESKLVTLACFLRSSLMSKPNSFAADHDPKSREPEDDLLRLVHRESALRYSVIGNWMSFVVRKHFNDDQIELIEQLKIFASQNNVKSIIVNRLNIDRNHTDSFINNEKLEFEIDKILVLDNLTLTMADKILFRSTKTDIQPITFGLNNLNICSLESLCLLDLKIFVYSAYFQSLSRVKGNEWPDLEPFYHPQTAQFCTDIQTDWWCNMTARILTSTRTRKGSWLDAGVDEPLHRRLDAKKQNELIRILELVRLKSNSIKIDSSRYKLSLKICAHVAKYLQYLSDCIDCVGPGRSVDPSDHDTIRLLTGTQEIADCAPKEKLNFLRVYTARYWNFVTRQAIKLKKLDNLADVSAISPRDVNESTLFSPASAYFPDTSLNTSSVGSNFRIFTDLFTFHESISARLSGESRRSTLAYPNAAVKAADSRYWDTIIRFGLLNLIHLIIQTTVSSDDMDEVKKIDNLDEALELFDLIDSVQDEDAAKESGKIDLELLKKIGELLVEERNQLESSGVHIGDDIWSLKLAKTNLLIESVKKKINLQFEWEIIGNEPETGADLETVKQLEKLDLEKEMNESGRMRRELEEQKQRLEEFKLEEEEKLRIEKEILEKTKCQLDAEMEKVRKEAAELARLKLETENRDKEQDKGQSKKIADLIDQMKKQKIQHIQMNIDTLGEQFDLIRTQNKQIENEIKQISKSSNRRMTALKELHETMDFFNKSIDVQCYDAQFREILSIFQQNPGFTQSFLSSLGLISNKLQSQPAVKPVANHTPAPLTGLKFPTNMDLVAQLNSSVANFNKERSINTTNVSEYYDQEEDEEDDYEGDEYDEDEEYEEDEDEDFYDVDQGGLSYNVDQTRQDTFLSCNDTSQLNQEE